MRNAGMSRRLAAWVAGMCGAGAVFAQPLGVPQPFIYPSRGQSEQQLQTDKGQCYNWAVQQSGYNPANPPPPPPPPAQPQQQQSSQAGRNIVGGGLFGAAIGSLSGHAGEGAAIGALFGGIRSAVQHDQQQQQQQHQAQQQQAASRQQQAAIQAQGLSNYQRAFRACMVGRGYTVD